MFAVLEEEGRGMGYTGQPYAAFKPRVQEIRNGCIFQALYGTRSYSYQISKEEENVRSAAQEYGLRMGFPYSKSLWFSPSWTEKGALVSTEAEAPRPWLCVQSPSPLHRLPR